MARRRRFGSVRGGQSARRRTSWSIGPEGILSPASTAVSGFATGVGPSLPGLTIVRVRGELFLHLLTSSVAQGGFQWAAGLAVVTAKAFGIGATAIPGPFTDIEWDGWLWHSQGVLKGAGSTLSESLGGWVQRVEIDSKAMRKLPEETILVGMLETVEVGTATMHVELRSRVLVKLP